MTREEAKEYLPIMQAFAEGKQIQYLDDHGFWNDIKTCVSFDYNISCYRIKPEIKYRPFKNQEECWEEMLKHQPFGWVRSKKCKALLWNVTSINKDDITIICDYYKFHRAFECFEFTDGTPFGIKEEYMTKEDYLRLSVHIAMLKDIAKEYPGKTIENIIAQLEARRKEIGNRATKQ